MDKITTLAKEEFPTQLLEIPSPPEKLFLRGTMPPENAVLLAVVGSRKYSPYGKDVCEEIIKGLAGHNISIVSGLALGIDSIAHRAALDAGLHTIAVPGSGLSDEVLYPATHMPLAHDIIESGGCLLSEFEPDFKATQWSFPQRNRLMAGLVRAVLIIEAEEKSGTLITARLATDYNRDVFAIPSSVFSENSKGSNGLLRQGALAITSSEDILKEFGLDPVQGSTLHRGIDCSDEEKKVLEILKEPQSRDELIRALGLPINKTNIIISSMEIKGLIKEQLGLIRKQ